MYFSIALTTLSALLGPSPVASLDHTGADEYLQRIVAEYPVFDDRLAQVLADSVGTPYFDGPLGEGPTSQYDRDPLVDFSRVDCVTAVEQAIALAASTNYGDFFSRLQEIRYKDGQIDYESRNHFMETDWVRNNSFCVPVTAELGIQTATVTRTISRRGFFERVKAPGLGHDTPDESVAFVYVPSESVEDAERALPNNTLILFVGRKPDWLFVLHCGVFVRDAKGVGRFYHASSKYGELVAMDLGDYVRDQGERYLGFAAYRIDEPARAAQ